MGVIDANCTRGTARNRSAAPATMWPPQSRRPRRAHAHKTLRRHSPRVLTTTTHPAHMHADVCGGEETERREERARHRTGSDDTRRVPTARPLTVTSQVRSLRTAACHCRTHQCSLLPLMIAAARAATQHSAAQPKTAPPTYRDRSYSRTPLPCSRHRCASPRVDRHPQSS
jgi:hypothetical protein